MIVRVLERSRTMQRVTLEQVLTCPTLPSLPVVALEILNLAGKRHVQLEEIASVVQNDAALSARILKTVNSSFYGLSKPCPSISRAVAYLGVNTVKSLVLGFSLFDWVGGEDMDEDLTRYWSGSLFSAAASRRLALATKACEPDEAFSAGLMQNIGMLALRRAIGPAYHEMLVESAGNHDRLVEACRQAFGFDHPTVGAALAERWRLPAEFVAAIREHLCPIPELPSKPALVQVVALSNHLLAASREPDPETAVERVNSALRASFSLSSTQAQECLKSANRDAAELSALLKVRLDGFNDLASILDRAEEARIQHHLELERESERLQQTNIDLVRQTLTDALTGVGSRKHMDLELARMFQHANARGEPLTLIMVDADRFKAVNDTHGHPVGDAVLAKLGQRIAEVVGDRGIVCRYGGEEFAALIPGADRRQAARVAEKIRLSIASNSFDVSDRARAGTQITITASVGVAVLTASAAKRLHSTHLLLQAADKALYAAKSSGRNCVRVFSPRGNGNTNSAPENQTAPQS